MRHCTCNMSKARLMGYHVLFLGKDDGVDYFADDKRNDDVELIIP
jgi:hypothetical protein